MRLLFFFFFFCYYFSSFCSWLFINYLCGKYLLIKSCFVFFLFNLFFVAIFVCVYLQLSRFSVFCIVVTFMCCSINSWTLFFQYCKMSLIILMKLVFVCLLINIKIKFHIIIGMGVVFHHSFTQSSICDSNKSILDSYCGSYSSSNSL